LMRESFIWFEEDMQTRIILELDTIFLL